MSRLLVRIHAYSRVEGADWRPWPATAVVRITEINNLKHGMDTARVTTLDGITFHALQLGDGRIWDTVNGWRK